MDKNIIISDSNKKSLKIKTFILKNFKKKSLLKSKLIIVIGGDGFMLKTLKKNKYSAKLFYGINSGSYGFLMNKFSPKNTLRNLAKAKINAYRLVEQVKFDGAWSRSDIASNFSV